MGKADEIYLAIVDEIVAELDKQKYKTKDEVVDKIELIKSTYIDDIESAIDEICDDYCDNNNLYWKEDEDEQ